MSKPRHHMAEVIQLARQNQREFVAPAHRQSVKFLAEELLALDAELESATPEYTSDTLISIAARAIMLANEVLNGKADR